MCHDVFKRGEAPSGAGVDPYLALEQHAGLGGLSAFERGSDSVRRKNEVDGGHRHRGEQLDYTLAKRNCTNFGNSGHSW